MNDNVQDIPDGLDLIKAWERAKADGVKFSDFAAEYGLKYNAMRSRLDRARREARDAGKMPEPEDLDPNSTDGPFHVEYDGPNKMAVEFTTNYDERITTLEQLLSFANVDLDVWEVQRHIINKWEVGAKVAKRRLRWEDGQIQEGFIDDPGELTIRPLIQVKAWMVRKKPIPIRPVIKPVTFQVYSSNRDTWLPRPPLATDGLHTALILPDPQFGFTRDITTGRLIPFHDRRALDVALQIAGAWAFDRVAWLGDLIDLAEWSDKFFRSPEMLYTTQAAVVESSWWMARFRAAQPTAKMDAIEGNHDGRMPIAVGTHLAASYNLKPADELDLPPALSVPRLLALHKYNIEWVGDYPNGRIWLNRSLALLHGDIARANPVDTAKAYLDKVDHSLVFGHIHAEVRALKNLDGRAGSRRIVAVCPGCLCRIDGVVPGHNKTQNWSQGVAVAYYDPDGDFHALETITIEDGLAVWGGKIFEAGDPLPMLEADTPGFSFGLS